MRWIIQSGWILLLNKKMGSNNTNNTDNITTPNSYLGPKIIIINFSEKKYL